MRALITGIGGQDGRILSDLLYKNGFQVTGTTRTGNPNRIKHLQKLLPESVDLAPLNVGNFASWINLLKSNNFEIIYHLAAQTSVGKSFGDPLANILDPAETSFYLLEAARLHQPNAKIILASSTEVFGSHGASIISENSTKKPTSPYAVGKLNQEAVASFYRNTHGLWVSNTYLSNHESIYRSHQFVTMKIALGALEILAKKNSTLKLGNLSVTRDWGWAAEYMDALIRLSERNTPTDIIIATGESISLLDFATEVFDYFGLSVESHIEHDSSLLRAGDPSEVHYDPSKARDILGWSAVLKGAAVPRQLAKSVEQSKLLHD